MGGERKKKTDIKTLPRRNYITYPVVTAFIIIVLIYIYIYEHGIVYKSFFVFFFCFKIDYSTELNYSAQRTRTYIYIVISGRQLIFAVVPPRGFRVRLPVLPVFNARLRRIRQNYSFLFFFPLSLFSFSSSFFPFFFRFRRRVSPCEFSSENTQYTRAPSGRISCDNWTAAGWTDQIENIFLRVRIWFRGPYVYLNQCSK